MPIAKPRQDMWVCTDRSLPKGFLTAAETIQPKTLVVLSLTHLAENLTELPTQRLPSVGRKAEQETGSSPALVHSIWGVRKSTKPSPEFFPPTPFQKLR